VVVVVFVVLAFVFVVVLDSSVVQVYLFELERCFHQRVFFAQLIMTN
jgi:hypothetical protein